VSVYGAGRSTRRQRITRPALSSRIRDAVDRGSLLLVADAGFGKTTALEEALLDGSAVAWFSCDEADREAGHLIVSVLEALRRAVPGAVDVLAERLTVGAGTIDPLRAAGELQQELDRLLVEPVALVLDDAERLAGSRAAVDVIARLVTAPSRLRVVVASRRELPLRTAKARASGALTVLHTADIAFTPEECERFLAMRTGRETSPVDVAEAMEATSGWPLGLELVATGGPFAARADSRRAAFARRDGAWHRT
jgi:LuxR family transcriptional regulator, maltose regulon positive regulatory protein